MAGSASLRVLLIEGPDGVARELLSSREGFETVLAERHAGAEWLSAGPGFDLLLVDLSGSGSRVLEEYLAARALAPGASVVVLCRDGDEGVPEAVLSAGAQDCIRKEGLDGRALSLALRQAALRARAQAQAVRARFDAFPFGVLLAAGRKVSMANQAALALLGRSEAELASLSVLDLFPEEARPVLQGALDSPPGAAPGARFAAGLGQPGAAPSECLVHVAGALLNDAPAVALYLVPVEDGRKPAQGGWRIQAEKMSALERLAGGMAHDFNNLFTAINGYGDHLLALAGSEGPLASGLHAIRRAGETAAAMTRSLAAFSRPAGSDARAVRVDDALREMAPMLREILGGRIELRLDLGAGEAAVRLEPGQLEQIILNLSGNAREAMPGGGVLTLATGTDSIGSGERAGNAFSHLAAKEGSHVAITVEDTGSGMGAETLERLFEPFYSTKRVGRGAGLGLANVYGIVSRAGGGLSVASAPGAGSRFRIHLAQDSSPIPADFPRPAPAWDAAASGSGSGTVLVVEDEPSLREMIAAILNRYGFRVATATSAEEALEAAASRTAPVDLVVTDVMLRGGEGGHELSESLQAIRPGLRTVFISGHSLESLAERGIFVPADDFLEKPFSPSQLAAKVRTALEAARNAP